MLSEIASIGACCAFVLGLVSTSLAQEQEPAPPRSNALIQEQSVQPLPLNPTEKLVLVFSKTTDRHGKTRPVLVFLGRPKNGGWEAIGNGDLSQLQSHWRNVAGRVFADVRARGLNEAELRKLDLAIELTIARFLRLYQGLQQDLLLRSDTPANLEVDVRYEQLRQAGNQGPFDRDSLAARIARTFEP
ncbi:MAG: hypothetical protein R3C53_04610 [Pirellulaceae bacterium]